MAKKAKPTGKVVLERIDRRLKDLELSDNRASEMATGSRDTLRSIRRQIASGRQRGISTETVQQFAPVLKTSVAWLLGEPGPEAVSDHIESSAILAEDDEEDPRKWTDIVGYVGAGARAHYYAVGQGALEKVRRPDSATDQTVAVQIMGPSLGKLFDRWLVFYDQVRHPITPDLIGELCVVGLSNDQVLIKKVRKSKKKPGAYDLESNTDEPLIEGADIVWAAKVKNIMPR